MIEIENFNSLYEYSQYIRNKKTLEKLDKVFKVLYKYPHLVENIYFEIERMKHHSFITKRQFDYYCFFQDVLKGKYDRNGKPRKGLEQIPISELEEILYNDDHKVSFWIRKHCSFMFVVLNVRDFSNYQSMIGFTKKDTSKNYSTLKGFF